MSDICMSHPDILTLERFGYIHGYYYIVYLEEEKIYCKFCGSICGHKICGECIDKAIVDDATRLAYIINSDHEFINDWLDYTREFWDSKPLSGTDGIEDLAKMSGIRAELLKDIPEKDIYCAVSSFAWVNEDRRHFRDWLMKRHC